MSENCDAGGSFDRSFDLIVSPPIQQAGNYTLSLVGSVVDYCGNSAELKTETIFMPLPPISSFNSPAPQCLLDNRFAFNYTGPSQVVDYFWDFGDSVGATVSSPLHTYVTPGTKDVSLMIMDVNGCADTVVNQVEVWPKPNARYIAPLNTCEWDTLSFLNETTFPGSPQQSIFWDLGDGNTTSDDSPIHYFSEYGEYRVYLEAENALGCIDTFSQTIIAYPKPDVDFIVEDNVCWRDTANLLFLSTIERLDKDYIDTWTWDFGDSTLVDSVVNPAHLYDSPGTYPVVLTVTSDKGCRDRLVKEQIIHHPPAPGIQNDTVCYGDKAVLQAFPVESGTARWFYEMNGQEPFSTLFVLETEDPVTFPYELYVEQLSPEGCLSERIPVAVRHFEVGEGSIVISDSSVEFPDPRIDFALDGTIQADHYEWRFGDGEMSAAASPSHLYRYAFIFDVDLDIIDIYGCDYQLSTSVEVKNPVAIHVPSGFTPNGDGSNDFLFIGHNLLQSFQFSLYNRGGNRIFTTNNPDFRWDGRTASGKAAMEGVYVYQLTGVDLTGQTIHMQGTVSVIR
jgi:gliding motility-associated-like protein